MGFKREDYMRRNSKGFSLIELLIVVAIILIIAAIAIPNLLRSRIAANQASAVGSLRTLNTANITYASTYNTGYSSALSYLGPSGAALPTVLGAGLVDSILGGTGSQFNANPGSPGTTGTNYYFTDQSGVIRQNSTAIAGSSDSPIGG
jgi:prepilin-type N-terminal cleavage/methylation domain-containing protein